MNEIEKEIESLLNQRSTYSDNLRYLNEVKAQYGINVPIDIRSSINGVQKEIDSIDEKLIKLNHLPESLFSINILERIEKIERVIENIQSVFNQYIKPSDFTWGEKWYHYDNEKIILQDNNTYFYKDLIQTERRFEAEIVNSLDTIHMILYVHNFTISFTNRVYENKNDWDQKKFYLFTAKSEKPVFSSTDDQIVYERPVFSINNRFIAYSFAYDFSPSYIQDVNSIDSEQEVIDDNIINTVDWKESIAIFDIYSQTMKILCTEKCENGYAKWAEARNFLNIRFVNNDSALFCVTGSRRGLEKTWYIPLDGSEIKQEINPFWDDQ
ncbi:hypothetical protein [Herpetosiphon llansteffanensis]|uniref:hypothetical protein n=1 Tax=Herpetosiphon llansteffanensis TaxID=2094568 RepID=UPI000D7C5F7B|nr:hypothetical protein [Herpetosiphon llansteffanensis]